MNFKKLARHKFKDLFLIDNNYDYYFDIQDDEKPDDLTLKAESEEFDHIPPMPPLEGDEEEVKEKKD